MSLLPGISSNTITTGRMRTHFLESGPAHGIPVIFIHGAIATGRFFEHIASAAPANYRCLMPDMRGCGDSENLPLDATRGLRDWADDVHALVQALGISARLHLVAWSTGGSTIAFYAMDHPGSVASLTFIDPVSPFGFGGTKPDGTPCFPDFAGTGGGTIAPEFVKRLAAKDRSTESPLSPRSVLNSSFWSANHREPPEREDILLEEVLKSAIGDDAYPGDLAPSSNWPGFAPGTRGLLNGLSGKYANWSGIVNLNPKPPILWTHGTHDIVIADGSAWEMGALGKMGVVPGYPGEEVYPPQPMVSQIRAVLEQYRDAGGRVQMEMFEGSGHGPHIDAADKWRAVFFEFLERAG